MSIQLNAHIFIKFENESDFKNSLGYFKKFNFITNHIGILDKYNLAITANFNDHDSYKSFIDLHIEKNPLIKKSKFFTSSDYPHFTLSGTNDFYSYLILEVSSELKADILEKISNMDKVNLCSANDETNEIVVLIGSSSFTEINQLIYENIWSLNGVIRASTHRIIDLFSKLQ